MRLPQINSVSSFTVRMGFSPELSLDIREPLRITLMTDLDPQGGLLG